MNRAQIWSEGMKESMGGTPRGRSCDVKWTVEASGGIVISREDGTGEVTISYAGVMALARFLTEFYLEDIAH